MRTLKRTGFLLVLAVLIFGRPVLADLRETFEDDQIVARSELIVVGHLDADSLVYVKKAAPGGEGTQSETRARLIVSDVLKGTLEEKEITVVIRHGLRVDVDGGPFIGPNPAGQWAGQRTVVIAIHDTGVSPVRGKPLVDDAGKDVLWFLRTFSAIDGHEPRRDEFGIADPEDMQPAELKDYFLAYLADDPEAAVKQYAEANAAVAERAYNALVHLDVQRILKIEDADERARCLVPYYTTVTRWSMSGQVRNGLMECGAVAGPYLLDAYNNPRNPFARRDVIHIWGRIKWDGCVEILVDLLDEHDRFFAGQTLEEGWRDDETDPELTQERDARYSETLSIVYGLGRIGDARAREVIERTKRHWQQFDPQAPRMVETCDKALKSLSADE